MRWLESNDLGLVLVALIGAMVTLLTGGKVRDAATKKGDPPQEFAEVKGALISDKAAERVIQSSDAFTAAATMLKSAIDRDVEAKQALTKALNLNVACMERNADVLKGNTDAANAVATRAHDLQDVVGDLAKEMEIQSRLRGRRE